MTVVPSEIDLELRDRLGAGKPGCRVHNVAGFIVGPGERVDTEFSKAISVSGLCSVHPGGRIEIRVSGVAIGG